MKNRSGEKIKLASIDELLGVVNEESAMEIEISKIHHSHAKDAAVYGLFRKDLWNLSAVRLKRRYPCVQCR